jgi:phosphopantetheinyl transferase
MRNTARPWLWLADIGPATEHDWVARHAPWLSESEQARLQRIARPERRAQLLAGHILLRRLVAACAGIAADAVKLCSQPDGRVELISPFGWQPSLAHSKQWVAALADPGTAGAGVDIELMQGERQIQAIVQLACAVEAESREDAYLLWAQREAELKARSGAVGTWVTTWTSHALAVCASASPLAMQVDLAGGAPARALELIWSGRPRLTLPRDGDGR